MLGPVVLMLLIRVTKSGLFTNTASDLRAAYNDVSKLFRPEEQQYVVIMLALSLPPVKSQGVLQHSVRS